MKTKFRFLAPGLVMALLAPTVDLRAQEAGGSPLLVGSRVRFSAPGVVEGSVTGKIVTLDAESMIVEVDSGTPMRVRRDAIGVLNLSVSRKRQWRKGLFIGAGLGAALFALSAEDSRVCGADHDLCISRTDGAVFGALLGAAYGAGIGALFKADRWSRVFPEGVRVSLEPTRGRGLRAALSIAF